MVDSIKSKVTGRESVSKELSSKLSQANLRNNFDALRTKSVIENTSRSSDVIVNVDRGRNTEKVTRTLRDLNDAVAHSTLALDALERIGGDDGGGAQLSHGVDELKTNIAGVLDSLRGRVDKAEIVRENFNAATARLEDVSSAQVQADNLSLQMQFEEKVAIDAHPGMSADRVQQLLTD